MTDITPTSPLPKLIEWRNLLTDYPPGTRASVEGIVDRSGGPPNVAVLELQLFCDGTCQKVEYCTGVVRAQGIFFPAGYQADDVFDYFLVCSCRKCQAHVKTFAVRVIGRNWRQGVVQSTVEVAKIAEWPDFSFSTPARVNTLIGPDRKLFFQGRKAESAGLGIGAFAYYRRIVEDQKNRLLNEIIRVARQLKAPAESISLLEAARDETQFRKAVDMIKDAVPVSLRIRGQNPLKLLHTPLSRDLHAASDEECLQVA